MRNYLVIDPDCSDMEPFETISNSPDGAVRNFYHHILEECPNVYAEKSHGCYGSGSFSSIGDVRVSEFIVEDKDSKEYFNIYFE